MYASSSKKFDFLSTFILLPEERSVNFDTERFFFKYSKEITSKHWLIWK